MPSTIVPPSFNSPDRSACSIMAFAALSLTEPPGFINSALPKISQPVISLAFFKRISGVLPIDSIKPE